MSTKLTLSISDKNLIEEAKKYAKENDLILSKIIEDYLKSLTSGNRRSKSKEVEVSPEVESLIGIIKTGEKKIDDKKERYERLEKKYLDE